MNLRALRTAALIALLGAASAAPSAFGGPSAPAMSVRAGVGGAARPGRWLPVDIALTAGNAALRGAINVEWGGATARRDIDLTPASTTHATLFLRTTAASPGLRVSVTDIAGNVVASTDAALTLLPVDDPVTLCIGGVPSSELGCTVSVADAEAPNAWRAYDIADDVRWPGAANALREQATAYALWRAARWWQDSGFVDPVVAPFDTDSRLAERTSVSLALSVSALIVLTALSTWRRASVLWLILVPIAVSSAGVALVTRSSRDVDIQSSSFVHQFTGVPRSLVFVKGEVEHPGQATLELTPDVEDASVDVGRGWQRAESAASFDGRARYRHTAGRGIRQRFELTGTVGHEWLSISSGDDGLSVTNGAPFAVTDCEFRSENRIPVGSIAAGASARAAVPASPAPGDALVCRLPPNWLTWSQPGASVRTRGTAFVILHVWPGLEMTKVGNAAR